MKQAILIQCHNKPEIVNAIIDFYPEQLFDFYIHIDKKSGMNVEKRDNVFFVENRVDVRWGQFSQVEATYALINSIPSPGDYSYCHFISGADFPVKQVEWFIDKYDVKNRTEYIQSDYLDGTSTWSWGGLDRVRCYYPQWIIKRPHEDKLMRLVRVCYREFIMRTRIFKRRSQPVDKFYGGSSWWSLTGDCVEWIRDNTTEKYYDFFKHGVCVDEVYFSTLIRYSPYADNISNQAPRFMNWDKPGLNTGGPADIELSDIPEIIDSEYPFARKVTDMEIVKKLCERLIERIIF